MRLREFGCDRSSRSLFSLPAFREKTGGAITNRVANRRLRPYHGDALSMPNPVFQRIFTRLLTQGRRALSLVALGMFAAGCGSKEPGDGEASSPARDAYAAARLLVRQSVASPATTRISSLDRESSTGARAQTDGTWKTWGWLELTGADGAVIQEEWRAVMRALPGEGRRWRALWLKVGDQQSGDPTAWRGE